MSRKIRRPKPVGKVLFVGVIVVFLVAIIALGFIMSNRIDSVQTENNYLQNQVNLLLTSNSQLQNNTYDLQSQYSQLQSSSAQLKSSYDELYSRYQQLLSKLPSSAQGITIDSIYSQPIFTTPSGIYNVTVRNHSSSDVHVTALKLYHDTVLASSASVSATIPANSTTIINQYMPWGDPLSTNAYILKIETLEGYDATSDPLIIGYR
jgi:hypothetical protein